MNFDISGKCTILAVLCVAFVFFSQPVQTAHSKKQVENLLNVFNIPAPFEDEHHRFMRMRKQFQGVGKQLGLNVSFVAAIIKKVSMIRLNEILSFDLKTDFSTFIPKHTRIASKLADLFLEIEDIQELSTFAGYIRSQTNTYLFGYSYLVALMNRPDTKNIVFPNHLQMFPNKYISENILSKARENLISSRIGETEPADIPFQSDVQTVDVERRMDYWREDLAINLHHWHWHLAYPLSGSTRMVNKDRRGELFYYMHSQVIARYNFERFCNNLDRVKELSDWDVPIEEEYFPNIQNTLEKAPYPNRLKNMMLSDVDAPEIGIQLALSDVVTMRNRVSTAIRLRFMQGRNRRVTLNNITGIDILSNTIESNPLSANLDIYRNLHGSGHILLALIHDPRPIGPVSMGVMGFTSTAMRDPVFYRWHGFVDEIFQGFKRTLPPYTVDQLKYSGIRVTSVNVNTVSERQQNVFRTFWHKTNVILNTGLDFDDVQNPIIVRYTHLNHRDFSYDIVVENEHSVAKVGTCRIYMSPAVDERGVPWGFAEQRKMFIELDKFEVTLQPGQNRITRKSVDSRVTISFQETFYNRNQTLTEANRNNIIGCGWPHHLLIPKGVEEGFPGELFVMISNYEDDEVAGSKHASNECYCGVKDSDFPDKRPMGYPFDRSPRDGVATLSQFLTPNMFVQPCSIRHDNIVVVSDT